MANITFLNIFAILSLLTTAIISSSIASTQSEENVFRRKLSLYNEIIDNGKYKATYEVDLNAKSVTFEVDVETTGFVGFGVSPGKGMAGADIIIGGVLPNGDWYFTDRFAEGQSEPKIDDEQNWKLLDAHERGNRTYLKFSRLLDTCDKLRDVPITDDTISIIWSYGETDEIVSHGNINRGSQDVNLLDQMPDPDISKFEKWPIKRTMQMPNITTSYWCTIHKAPKFERKHHIVGFNTRLETPEALKHTHHLGLAQCHAPEGEDIDEFFEKYEGKIGGECYDPDYVILKERCTTMLHTWAVGGKAMFLPENAGYSMSENVSESVYIMYEIHYDNPQALSGVTFESTVEVYHTPDLREHEAAQLLIDHATTFSLMIPGNTKDFVIAGHCQSECTRNALDDKGINIFNVLLHSHLRGRKLKLRQFRDEEELPWITVDNNYAFDYQQNRPIRSPRHIQKGDHLTIECTMDSSTKSNVTFGGLSTNAEMCQAIMWYYPKSDFQLCESVYPEWIFLEKFGVEKIQWQNFMEDPWVLLPEKWAGKSLVEVVTTQMKDWSPDQISELGNELRFSNHYELACGYAPFPWPVDVKNMQAKSMMPNQIILPPVNIGYPKINKEYVPQDFCPSGGASNVLPNKIGFISFFGLAILSLGQFTKILI